MGNENLESAKYVEESAFGNIRPLEKRLVVHQVGENIYALMTGRK